jgi:hypothetical protein
VVTKACGTSQVDAIDYMRTLSGRQVNPTLEAEGDQTALTAVATARVAF